MKYFIVCFVIVIFSADLFASSSVVMMMGDVQIQVLGSTLWQKVKNGQKINFGDTLQTGAMSFAEIETNQNRIRIQPKTKVRFSQEVVDGKPQGSLSLFTGSVNCKMDKLKKNNEGYNVNTPSSVCSVRGTEFDVAASAEGKTVLQVTDGTVAFSGMSKSVDVAKNQESAVTIGGEPEPVKIIKKQDWEKWANESSNDVRGKESDIISGCRAKIEKLDSDIQQLEKQSAEAKVKSDDLKKQAVAAKDSGDMEKAKQLAGEAQRNFSKSTSMDSMAYYQASRIDLIKGGGR